jgi:hypothetical protein
MGTYITADDRFFLENKRSSGVTFVVLCCDRRRQSSQRTFSLVLDDYIYLPIRMSLQNVSHILYVSCGIPYHPR